jgi:hypothetical protein
MSIIFSKNTKKDKIMGNLLNGPGVRDSILEHGKTATEGAAYFWGNVTKGGSRLD